MKHRVTFESPVGGCSGKRGAALPVPNLFVGIHQTNQLTTTDHLDAIDAVVRVDAPLFYGSRKAPSCGCRVAVCIGDREPDSAAVDFSDCERSCR